jgi:hypothetical protein
MNQIIGEPLDSNPGVLLAELVEDRGWSRRVGNDRGLKLFQEELISLRRRDIHYKEGGVEMNVIIIRGMG